MAKQLEAQNEKLREVYAKLSPDQKDARDVRQMKDVFDRLQTVLAEALVDASENFQAASENFQAAQENATEDGGVKHQARPSKKDPSVLDPRTATRSDVAQMLENVKDGKYPGRTYIPVRISTPGIVQERLFAKDLPIIMPVSKVAQALAKDNGPVKGENVRGHEFSVDDLIAIIDRMDSPDYIYSQADGRGVEVIKLEDNADSTVAIVEFDNNINPDYMNGYEGGTYNVSVTMFDVDGGNVGLFMYGQNKGWHEVFNKQKEGDPAKKFPATRPFAVEQDSLTENVSQPDAEVKEKILAKNSDGNELFYGDVKYSERVKDKKTLDFLNKQKTITTYKTMQLVDGKLYPPMAARTNGQYEDYSVLGVWEQATEHPELIRNGSKFKLDKGKGQGSIEAAYNPYMHSSNLVLNDQFSGAYTRDNLVTVECEVPVSELTSGYKAQYAKDSVGWHAWHTGTVAGSLRKERGIERQVFLSRWIKPVRIVADSEVAAMYKSLLNGTDIAVPDNVVTPSLLKELENAGVKISKSGRVKYSARESDGNTVKEKFSERDRQYSYDSLISKPDMAITTVSTNVPKNRADVVYQAKQNAAKVGKFDPKTGSVSVYVDDIGADVFLGTTGLKHGLRRTKDPQNDANYIVTLKAGEIITNSIQINEMNPKKADATEALVLIGVARNLSGEVYVVRSIVNRFSNELASIDVLYAINAKKEELAATKSPRFTAEPLSETSSTISIAELLDLVNQYFPDILPEDVLKHYGYDARPAGDLGKDALYSERDKNYAKVAKQLEAQNEKLREDVTYLKKMLKLQKSLTHGKEITKSSVEAAAIYL